MHPIFSRLYLAASVSLLFVSPLLAKAPDGGTPPQSVAAWVKAVNAKVERAMVEPHGVQGVVTASFRRAEDGRAAEVQVVRATPGLERAMRNTLRSLRQLPPMPRSVDPNQRVKVQLLFDDGSNTEAYLTKRRALLAMAEEANRQFAGGSTETVLALSNAP